MSGGAPTVRLLAIGDIHGCYKSLTELERYASFASDDVIVTMGDYVDRGPESRSVLDWLIAREAQFHLVPLLGNHELMMLAAYEGRHYDDWISCGGDAALRSYESSTGPTTLADVPESHWRFIKSCRAYHETVRVRHRRNVGSQTPRANRVRLSASLAGRTDENPSLGGVHGGPGMG